MDLSQEIKILQDNIRTLQKQLGQAHQRIGELMSEKTASNEEVIKHKEFIQEISHQLKQKEILNRSLYKTNADIRYFKYRNK